ncbi:MAG: DUF63 family protein [Archaeoglobaceae archaeon]
MDIWEFIRKYYIDSIVYKEGYNVVNTITWAAILVIAVFLLYRFLEKRFEIDEKFVIATVPYIFLGSSSRVLEDAGFLNPPISYLFMSPFIFLLIFLLAFPTLMISGRLTKRYYIPYAFVGLIPSFFTFLLLFSNLVIVNPLVFPNSIALASLVTFLYYATFKKTRNFLSILIMFAHMLDGFASCIGIQFYDYVEIHVLPRFIVDNFGPLALPIVKFIVISTILYLIEGEEKRTLKNFIKLVLLVFGFAPALRNALRITFGV